MGLPAVKIGLPMIQAVVMYNNRTHPCRVVSELQLHANCYQHQQQTLIPGAPALLKAVS